MAKRNPARSLATNNREADLLRAGYVHAELQRLSGRGTLPNRANLELAQQHAAIEFPYPVQPKIVRAVWNDGSRMYYRVVDGVLEASRNENGPFNRAQHNRETITALYELFQAPNVELTTKIVKRDPRVTQVTIGGLNFLARYVPAENAGDEGTFEWFSPETPGDKWEPMPAGLLRYGLDSRTRRTLEGLRLRPFPAEVK